jgi:formiminoglutamate deiminase
MGEVVVRAAAEAGVRITLIDACYLRGGFSEELDPVQRRFADADVHAWAERVGALRAPRVGAAIHSVRAVDPDSARTLAAWAAERGAPLHAHVSEQPGENEGSLAATGLSPTALLASLDALSESFTAVHATHLTDVDIGLLGGARATCCFCPTTERDLADGVGPSRALRDAGSPLSLGSDQHAVVDLIEEARALEMHERLTSLRRGRFRPDELLHAATAHASLGWPDAGRLEAGARADLVAVRLDSPRTAGCDPAQVLMAATAADVHTVVVDGVTVVSEGRHRLGEVGALLQDAIGPLWEDA